MLLEASLRGIGISMVRWRGLCTQRGKQKALFNHIFARSCKKGENHHSERVHKEKHKEKNIPVQRKQDDVGRIIVFYDGKCGLCSAEIRHYEGLLEDDRETAVVSASRIAFFDLTKSASETQEVLSMFDIPLEEPFRRVHVIADRAVGEEENYEVLVSTRAFCEIWSRVPRWRLVEPAVRNIPGVIQLSDFVYACIAETRLKFLPSK